MSEQGRELLSYSGEHGIQVWYPTEVGLWGNERLMLSG